MLDLRIYRAAFIPVVLAVLIAGFSLAERPRPIGTTLAPDAFDGQRAYAGLTELDRRFSRRAPGSPATTRWPTASCASCGRRASRRGSSRSTRRRSTASAR
jgi:hypothetical protein